MAQQHRLGEFVGGMQQKPNTLVRRRGTVASLPRRHMGSVVGPAGKAEDASDASSTSPNIPYVSDLGLCNFAWTFVILDSVPYGFDVKPAKLVNRFKT